MIPLPSGTVTFLMTDVEQSARLWEQSPDRMRAALIRHDALAQACVAQHGGALVKPRGEGDSLFAVFERATDALQTAIAFQNALQAETWETPFPLRVRMALHTGEADLRDDDYYGATVNRCGRIRGVAHGGQILLSQPATDLTRGLLPPDARLHDLGTHGLRDLQRPERLHQLLCPGWQEEFPPLRSLDAYRHNLPRQLTSFIGREDEMAQIRTLLADTCLLTLTGSGGSGKTRLALQVGAEVVDAYEDGVWLVELAPFSDPELIAREIVKALSCREEPGRGALDTLCDHLKPRSILLILDNCEHMVEHAAQAAHILLKACPGLRILATSRTPLNVPGETAWRVPSLLVPDDDARPDVDAAMRHASLRLFVERATSARPQFIVTKANLPAVTQICRRLDGIPLAIELAAARVNSLTVQQVAQRLDKRFSLLVGGSRAVLERHQTLRALIDWSHDLLTARERVLLRRLAVFAGGWTMEAAESVCAWGEIEAEDVLELLSRLVETSLVIAEEQQDAHRYRLLETVRQYAQERLQEAEEDGTAREGHLHFFVALAEEAEPNLTGAEQSDWLQKLETEHDNLRAALAWAIEGDTRLRMAGALWRFWLTRYISEGRGWLEGALASGHGVSETARAKAQNALGVLATRQGDCDQARPLLAAAVAARCRVGDARGTAESLINLANLERDQNNKERAQPLYEEGLELSRKTGARWLEAAALNNLGTLTRDRGDLDAAQRYYASSLTLYRALQDAAHIAICTNNLAIIAFDRSDYAAALPLYTECLAFFRSTNHQTGIAITLHNLALVTHELQGAKSALPLLHESILLRVAIGDKAGLYYSLTLAACIAVNGQRWNRAAQLIGASRGIQEALALPVTPEDAEENSRRLAKIEAVIGTESLDAGQDAGRALSWEQAAAYALENDV